jgi:predicted nucleic acid-binding protein
VIVVDASALVVAVTDTTERGARARSRLADGCAAPHLIDAEVGQSLRGLVLRGLLDEGAAERSLEYAEHLVVDRYPHQPLRRRAWALRYRVSFYDGLYVALATLFDLPLVTADARLAAAVRAECTVDPV